MGPKSKSGCITCRIRRIKCDETKPQCNRCVSERRLCDGYLDGPDAPSRRELAKAVRNLQVLGPASRALSRSPASSSVPVASRSVSPHDAIHFDMFRRLTGPWTASLFPSDFWCYTALQLAHDEPAIWHAAVAVGMLHQKEGSSAAEHHLLTALGRDAELHYNKAMRLAREMTSATRLVALCMLLVAAANMLDHWAQAQTHLLSGLKITAAETSEDLALKDLRDSLVRLDLQSMTFSESSCPYPYAQSADAFSTDSFLATLSFHHDTDYAQLSSELFGMNRALFLLEDASIMDEDRHGPWLNKFEMFTRTLTRWEVKVADFEARLPQQSNHFVSRLALRLHHAMLRLMIQAVGPGPETKFDAMIGVFEYMVRLAATLLREIAHSASPSSENGLSTFSEVTLSLEPGVIVPLWVVIHNCRHRELRHAALNLLRDANRRDVEEQPSGQSAGSCSRSLPTISV